MQPYFKKLAALLLFHALWGAVLGVSISNYGLGISTDASAYLFAAENLSQGQGLRIYDGSAYLFWPPLYPMLLAAIQAISGQSAFVAAHILQFTAFGLVAVFSSLLLLKIFPDDFALVFLATFLLDTAPVVVSTFQMVGSDYLFMLFPLLLALLIARYQQEQSGTLALLIGLTAALGMLLRYIGYTLVLLGLWAVCCSRGSSWPRRLHHITWTGLWALVPTLWMVNTWLTTADQRRAPLSLWEYLRQMATGILSWFFALPPLKEVPNGWVAGVLAVLVLTGLLWLALARQEHFFSPYLWPVVTYGLIYTLALLGQASIAYFNRLWGRFLLPLYFPLLLLEISLLQFGLSYLRQHVSRFLVQLLRGVSGLLLLTLALAQTLRTAELLQNARQGLIPENIYNTAEWRANSLLHYWRAHAPVGDYILLSNLPAGVAFHTRHETLPSPRKRAVYDTEIIPLEHYRAEIFSSGQPVYLIWIEPNPYEHVYLPEELSPLARLETILKKKEGAIYRLYPH